MSINFSSKRQEHVYNTVLCKLLSLLADKVHSIVFNCNIINLDRYRANTAITWKREEVGKENLENI